jgi:hypothetical protein
MAKADDEAPEALPGAEGSAPIDFTTFILSMSTSCMIQLGEIADPDGRASDLEGARHTIEILQMLDKKTRGRLSGEEERMLSHVLDDLRRRYLERWSAQKKK